MNVIDSALNITKDRNVYYTDPRISNVIGTETKIELPEYKSVSEWEKRKKHLKKQIMLSLGLLPGVEKCRLNSKIFDSFVDGGVKISKFTFESLPGYRVTGNIYMPEDYTGKIPAILNPHGHWENGRLESTDICDVPKRCYNFAKMGFLALSYDMIGKADNIQVKDHGAGTFTGELQGVSPMGIQIYNGIRCLDFLFEKFDVDKEKIGCTGASGGGTQTLFISILDDRIKACAPVNMISWKFQGGCFCENAPLLRIGTNNVEFMAMFAPKPLFLVGTSGDWTENTPKIEYPYIKNIYKLYSSNKIGYFYQKSGHNYNEKSRTAVYGFFLKIFKNEQKFQEYKFNSKSNLNRLKIYHKKTADNLTYTQLFNLFEKQRTRYKNRYINNNYNDTEYTDIILGVDNKPKSYKSEFIEKVDKPEFVIKKYCLTNREKSFSIPYIEIFKEDIKKQQKTIIIFSKKGKGDTLNLLNFSLIKDYINKGHHIIIPNLFMTGEYINPAYSSGRRSEYSGKFGKHFTAFNYTDDAIRVNDIIKVTRHFSKKDRCKIISFDDAAVWTIPALHYISDNDVVLNINQKLPLNDKKMLKKCFIPCYNAIGGIKFSLKFAKTKNNITIIN